ncbi:hypothetical protein EVJ58_g7925 [Rhodofomes roseus]|uniref:Uncharacterized protein n=1 Tax=Rhodofomes roseus TaxID=34475 RepID=A0A4Y9Y0T9_9APHY|nr:hypothetical protein EVJ58_g7925 [Rhodofomes roseus]
MEGSSTQSSSLAALTLPGPTSILLGDSPLSPRQPSRTLAERVALPLCERIVAAPNTSTSLVPTVAPQNVEFHVVTLTSGVPLRTRVPITEPSEALEYLNHPFEQENDIEAFRLVDENDAGPDPFFPEEGQHPVPSPQHLLAEGDNGYLATVMWLRMRPSCMETLSKARSEWPTFTSRQWGSRLRASKPLMKVARRTSDRPLPDEEIEPYRNPLPREREHEVWELRIFHFRLSFEHLAYKLHPRITSETDATTRGNIWAEIRDRIRRAWGTGVSSYPSYLEPRYFDSDDDLVRLRHWFALARIMLEWNIRTDLAEDLHLAMRGYVTDAAERIRAVYVALYRNAFKNRDPHVFSLRLTV